METIATQFICLLLLAPVVARAADTNPPPRLTVELRDGSRVIGTSAEKNFKFHSALLGEIKLAVNTIQHKAINLRSMIRYPIHEPRPPIRPAWLRHVYPAKAANPAC